MKIAFDVDGVVRGLMQYLKDKYGVPTPNDYSWTFKGKNIYDIAKDENFDICLLAPTTEYYEYIKRNFGENIEFWTHQPDDWQPNSIQWLSDKFGSFKVNFLDTKQKREKLDMQEDYILVEDNPNFSSYDRIILIDRPWNQDAKAEIRVKNVKELDEAIRRINGQLI